MTLAPVGEAPDREPSTRSERAADAYASWWRVVQRWARTLAGREALLLLGAGALVQLVMPYRYDLPCHVLGGGAGSLLLAALLPERAARRLGPWLGGAVFVALCVLGWIAERVVYGPFDLVDVAFTFAGAFVVSDASARVATAPTAERLRVVGVAVALLALSVSYHYAMGLGVA